MTCVWRHRWRNKIMGKWSEAKLSLAFWKLVLMQHFIQWGKSMRTVITYINNFWQHLVAFRSIYLINVCIETQSYLVIGCYIHTYAIVKIYFKYNECSSKKFFLIFYKLIWFKIINEIVWKYGSNIIKENLCKICTIYRKDLAI